MKKRERITRFIVAKTLLPLTSGGYLRRWYIYRNNIPIMVVNNFLRWKSINSPLTGRTYSYALAAWMNFLLDNRKNLLDAKICDLKSYVHYLVYRIDKNLLSISSKIALPTLSGYINAIGSFYKWLEDPTEISEALDSKNNLHGTKGKERRKWLSQSFKKINANSLKQILDIDVRNLKISKKTKQWLSELEKDAIFKEFNTFRDKSIFSLLLEGMRIDEVLSLTYKDLDLNECMVKPRRSKGKKEISDIRYVYFTDHRTAEYITKYVQTERSDVEAKLNTLISPLFINLKRNQAYGQEVTYRNYYEILKRAAKMAGLDSKLIATHVGRRTHVQEMLDEGEDSYAIKLRLGWSSIVPLEDYMDSKKTLKRIAERMQNRKSYQKKKKITKS